jgi:hypothetical protein
MKSKILLVVMAMILAIAGAAGAHTFGSDGQGNPFFAPAVPAEYIPTYDGDLSDWAWFPPAYIFTPDDFIAFGNWNAAEADVPKDDFDVVIYGPAWIPSQNMMTFAVHKVDDIFSTHSESFYDSWDEDVVQFSIDADHGGEDVGGGEDYQQSAFSPKLGGMTGCYASEEIEWAYAPPYLFFGMSPAIVEGTNGTFDVELQHNIFDWMDPAGIDASTMHTLAAGQIIGYSMEIIDTEEGVVEFPDVEFDWANTANGGTALADYFLMSEEDTRPLIPTAVESTSWGRVKSALQ